MNHWQKICAALAPFEALEPALESLRWSLYLYKRAGKPPSATRAWGAQVKRWLYAPPVNPAENPPVWYALHGVTPSHLLPLEGVMAELARRGVHGQVIGPYPFTKLPLADGWHQVPIDVGTPEASPILFWKLRSKASNFAPEIYKVLLEQDLWPVESTPSVELLVDWVWSSLRLDWNIAQRLQKRAPRVLVLGADLGPLRNPLTRHARAMGAYTLVLQHGTLGEYSGSVSSDEVSLWGEHHRRTAIKLGAPPNRLVVDGSPRMDKILSLVNTSTCQTGRAKLGISADVPVILHILDNIRPMRHLYPEITDRFLQDAPVAFEKISRKAVLLIRPHPSAEEEEWIDFVKTGARIIGADDMQLYEALAICDVASTMISSVGLEALWCGRPVIYYQPKDIPPLHNFVESGGGIAVSSVEEWIGTVLALAHDPQERQRRVENAADFCADTLAFPGKASHRVADRLMAHLL